MTAQPLYDDCGEYKAYQRHVKSGTPVDDACRKAKNAYARDLRQRNPDLANRQRRDAAARSRALTRLAAAHQADYLRLFDAERNQATR